MIDKDDELTWEERKEIARKIYESGHNIYKGWEKYKGFPIGVPLPDPKDIKKEEDINGQSNV